MVCILKSFGADNDLPPECSAAEYLNQQIENMKNSNSISKDKYLEQYYKIKDYMDEKSLRADLMKIKASCGFHDPKEESDDMDEENEETDESFDGNDESTNIKPVSQTIVQNGPKHKCSGKNCRNDGQFLNSENGLYYCSICYTKSLNH